MRAKNSYFVGAMLALFMLLAMPVVLGSDTMPVPATESINACAKAEDTNGSCCRHDAICGLNGQNYDGFHFVDGSCS